MRPVNASASAPGFWIRATPLLFVFFWSTGFIAAKAGLLHAGPMTFLLLRFALVVALMLPITLAFRAPWPSTPMQWVHIAVAGLLVQGGYLGGVFSAIHAGLAAGLAALICGLQPILTAFIAAPVLGERVTRRQWTGLLLGLAGVALVLEQKLDFSGASVFSVGLVLVALVSITVGTVYQKRFCPTFDLRSGSVIQFVAAALLLLPFALLTETLAVEWTPAFMIALLHLVLVLSIVSISLLALIIRRGAATQVASLFYLTPPVTAVEAWLLFDETLGGWALAGMVLAVAGVALVVNQGGQRTGR